jgi:hypothetical protein
MTPTEQAALRWPAVTPEEPETELAPGNVDTADVPRKSITHWIGPGAALGLLGLGSWAYGVSSLGPTDIGRDGLLVSGSAWLVVGLMLLLTSFLLELRGQGRSWMLGLQLIGLVVAIHGTVPIIFGAPEYAWVYKHVGIASSFQRYGRVTDPSSIYQEWPALFAAVASLSSLAHTNPLSFATWAPLAFELADALLLVALFRLLVGKRRVVWLAVLLYEGLISWVGQDYLSPQAFTFLLWLGMAVIILRWLRAPVAAAGPRGRLARLRAPLIAGMPAAPETSKPMRAVAVALVVTIYVAIVATHQLTPYMVIASVAALTLLDLVRPRWLVLVLAVIAGGYLALHYGLIAQQFGGLFSGGNPLTNASGANGTPHPSGGAIWSSRVVDLLIGGMWLASVGVIVRCRRRLGQVAIPALLALSPFVILLAQSYGGEAIYRVYLFSGPWCALLIAGALWGLRPNRRWPLVALVSAAALFAGVEGLYGPAQVNGFTSQEVNASLWMYSHISPRALIVLPVENFPALESANYNRYDIQTLPSDPQIGPSYLDEGSVPQVENWITGLGHRSAYVIVSRSMDNWSNFYGAPQGYATLVRDLPTAFHGTIVYQNRDVKIYRVTVPGTN